MADLSVANTILAQLGGRRFIAMTGASSFSGGSNALGFRVPAKLTKNKISGVRITLDDNDTYTVTFLAQKKAPTFEVYTVAEHSLIYFDQLEAVFTSETGLATHL
jgi:hypothetical protein